MGHNDVSQCIWEHHLVSLSFQLQAPKSHRGDQSIGQLQALFRAPIPPPPEWNTPVMTTFREGPTSFPEAQIESLLLLTLSEDIKNLDPLFKCCCICLRNIGVLQAWDHWQKHPTSYLDLFGHCTRRNRRISRGDSLFMLSRIISNSQTLCANLLLQRDPWVPAWPKFQQLFRLLNLTVFTFVAKVGTFHGFPWLRRGSSIQTCPWRCVKKTQKRYVEGQDEQPGPAGMGSHASLVRSSLAFRSLASKQVMVIPWSWA